MTSETTSATGRRHRVTIADVARRAGVTTGAVSMAVNGKPGVSDETRRRIVAIADEMNWRPSHAAQALKGKSAEAIGLVLARPAEVVGEEVFFTKFIAGVQSVLSEHGYSLHLQMARDLRAESAIHRAWIADGRVDGILILDPRADDPRIRALTGSGMPTLVVGGDLDDDGFASLRTDDGALMRLVLDHLVALGHERIGYVTGDQSFAHIRRRMDAFSEYMVDAGTWGAAVAGDFDPALTKQATARLVASPRKPTALVYDSEVMAVAGIAQLVQSGLDVPGDVSVVSWEDSATCRVMHPSVTALNRDAVSLGKSAATEILQLLRHESPEQPDVHAAVVARESTAAPR